MEPEGLNSHLGAPKITVTMPVYNGEAYLREAIDSILGQTFDDFELLIINDGSTDNSLDIILSYTDPRIRLLQNKKNSGLVITRNKGFENSKGEFIAILDCDDIAHPNRLTEQLKFMEANPEFGMIGSWVELIDKNGISKGNLWESNMDKPAEVIPATLLFYNCFVQSSVLIRKSCLPKECYRAEFPEAEDYDLWVRIAENSKVWNLPNVLTKYRVHTDSTKFVKADRLEKCVQKIVNYQLETLGIDPTPAELATHRTLTRLNFPPSKDLISDSESWLLRLISVNRTIKRFPIDHFQEVIAERWFLVCKTASVLGIWVLMKFWQSPLKKKNNITMKDKIIFIYRSLAGRKYAR